MNNHTEESDYLSHDININKQNIVIEILNILEKHYTRLEYEVTIYRLKRQYGYITSPRYNDNYCRVYSRYKRYINRDIDKLTRQYNRRVRKALKDSGKRYSIRKHRFTKKRFLAIIDKNTTRLAYGLKMIARVEAINKVPYRQRMTIGIELDEDIQQFIYYLLISQPEKVNQLLIGDTQAIYNMLSSEYDYTMRTTIEYKTSLFISEKQLINPNFDSVKFMVNVLKNHKKYSTSLGEYFNVYYTGTSNLLRIRTLDLRSILNT